MFSEDCPICSLKLTTISSKKLIIKSCSSNHYDLFITKDTLAHSETYGDSDLCVYMFYDNRHNFVTGNVLVNSHYVRTFKEKPSLEEIRKILDNKNFI